MSSEWPGPRSVEKGATYQRDGETVRVESVTEHEDGRVTLVITPVDGGGGA